MRQSKNTQGKKNPTHTLAFTYVKVGLDQVKVVFSSLGVFVSSPRPSQERNRKTFVEKHAFMIAWIRFAGSTDRRRLTTALIQFGQSRRMRPFVHSYERSGQCYHYFYTYYYGRKSDPPIRPSFRSRSLSSNIQQSLGYTIDNYVLLPQSF